MRCSAVQCSTVQLPTADGRREENGKSEREEEEKKAMAGLSWFTMSQDVVFLSLALLVPL